jgi:hypothetical protein
MMKPFRTNSLLVTALIALAIVLFAYACRFHSLELSHDPEDWAKFGEYAGGTLGAAFGLLAIVGVLLTIEESREGHRPSMRKEMIAESWPVVPPEAQRTPGRGGAG